MKWFPLIVYLKNRINRFNKINNGTKKEFMMLKRWLMAAGLIAGVFVLPLTARAQEVKKEDTAVSAGQQEAAADQQPQTEPTDKEKIEALDQKIRVLERLREIEQEKAKEKEKTATIVGAGKDGFSIKSADGAFVFKFRGLMQADLRVFGENSHPPIATLGSNPTTFTMRRVRPTFEGTVFNIFDFKFMPDFGEGKTVLQDAYVSARFLPTLAVVFGKMKEPFGLERLQSTQNIIFIERALPTDVAPNRDVGVQITGDVLHGTLNYSLGVFNGVLDGASADIDVTKGKDIVGRVFARPFRQNSSSPLQGLGFGIAVSSGHQDGALSTYKTIGQQTFFSYSSSTVGVSNIGADGAHTRVSPQGYFYHSSFGLMFEYSTSSQWIKKADLVKKTETRAKIQNTSWQLYGSYILTGEKASFSGFTPANPFNPKDSHWGAFEVAARYSQFDIDDLAFSKGFSDLSKSASQAKAWGVAFNWYMNKFIRYAINYDQTQFKRGAVSGDRHSENVIMSRCQIAF